MKSKISIFGLGYVGTVSAACLAKLGHQVIGVDVNPQKVEIINSGRSPVIEKDINEVIAETVSAGLLRATTDVLDGVMSSDISIICVGTPSHNNGSLNLSYVERVAEEIGDALRHKESFHTIILRSTVLPGTTDGLVIPALERTSGRVAGEGFGICFNPEFLREGTSVFDFFNPPYTVIGQFDSKASEIVSELYGSLEAPVYTVPLKSAEMIKYANNAFHALKVGFANEIGNFCKEQGVDSHQVMEIFCKDTKLNLSPYYLKPGFAFGGSCLPKDLRAILYEGHRLDLRLPILEAILPSNEFQIQRGYKMVKDSGKRKVGFLGFSFKDGTDDLRESPQVILIEMLIGKGYDIKIYDKNVSLARLHGANRAYIEREIPHISTLMSESIEDVVNKSEVIVIGNKESEFLPYLKNLRPEQVIIDLVKISKDQQQWGADYHGICW